LSRVYYSEYRDHGTREHVLLTRRHAMAVVWLAAAGRGLRAQEERPSPKGPNEFVSGTVAELSGSRIVVNRAVLGKPAEHLAFAITSETKVEGDLRVAARVTVGYRNIEGGEPVAVRIIVRPNSPQNR
jgi:hypothetical protein